MTDTAQALAPAETVVASDPLTDAANAFKMSLGQIEAPERPRDEHGRFASTREEAAEEAEQIEDEAEAVEAEVESDDDEATAEETDEAAEEAQPEAVDMPASWSKDDAELWTALPPEAQAKIAEREGQRDAAVNAKFQEAANLRKAHEADISEAIANRTRYAEAIDQVMSLVAPQAPPLSMLDINSIDYDPDAYHLRRAQYEQNAHILSQLGSQRQQIAAQAQAEEQRAVAQRFHEVEEVSRPAFLKDVPEALDEAKAPAVFGALMEYAMAVGAPKDTFQTPTTTLEWHLLWKAREYDRLQQAKAKVKEAPKPEPRKPQPAIRPGVATSRSAAVHAQKSKDFSRLAQEGSIDAGAAVFKHFLKG